MRRLLRLPPKGRSGQWLLALGVALVLAVQPIWPDRTAVGVTAAIGLTLLAASRWQLRWLPVVVLIGCAVALRLAMIDQEASDVADVTQAAIANVISGANPYGIGYDVSRPPGAPFPYGPIVLLWYLPALGGPALLELGVSIALTVYFGVRAANGRPMGLALFAVAPPLVLAAVDGSNDTSAGLLILAALACSARRPVLGSALLAVAVAFKPYALAWLPPLVMWAGPAVILAFAATSIVAWAPVLFTWGPESYLRSLGMAHQVHLRQSHWSLAAILEGVFPSGAMRALETIRYFLSGAVAVLGGVRVRSIDGVILVGTFAFLIAQFGGYFGSYVYLAALAPILCWRIDDWLVRGLPGLSRAYRESLTLAERIRQPAPVPASGAAPAAASALRVIRTPPHQGAAVPTQTTIV